MERYISAIHVFNDVPSSRLSFQINENVKILGSILHHHADVFLRASFDELRETLSVIGDALLLPSEDFVDFCAILAESFVGQDSLGINVSIRLQYVSGDKVDTSAFIISRICLVEIRLDDTTSKRREIMSAILDAFQANAK